MIPLSLDDAFGVYFTLCFFLLAFLWFREELRVKKNQDWSAVKDRLYLCDHCRLSFLSRNDSETITRCPRCNEMCFIRKRKRF